MSPPLPIRGTGGEEYSVWVWVVGGVVLVGKVSAAVSPSGNRTGLRWYGTVLYGYELF